MEEKEANSSTRKEKTTVHAQFAGKSFRKIINIVRVSYAERKDRKSEEREEITVKLLENE